MLKTGCPRLQIQAKIREFHSLPKKIKKVWKIKFLDGTLEMS